MLSELVGQAAELAVNVDPDYAADIETAVVSQPTIPHWSRLVLSSVATSS